MLQRDFGKNIRFWKGELYMEKYTRTISERDLENARWHFNNNMTYKMQADMQNYKNARADIAYLLELREEEKVEKTENCSQACPRCGRAVNGNFCSNCGQALRY